MWVKNEYSPSFRQKPIQGGTEGENIFLKIRSSILIPILTICLMRKMTKISACPILEPIYSHFFKDIASQINHHFFLHSFILLIFTVSFSSENKCMYLISLALKTPSLSSVDLDHIHFFIPQPRFLLGLYRFVLSVPLFSHSEVFLS